METEIKKTLSSAKDFIKEFCSKITSSEINESAKQVFFLDNQQMIKETLEKLNNIKEMYAQISIAEDSEDEKYYELCTGLMDKLTHTLESYRNSYSKVNPNITVEETTVVVNEETINDAAQNNSSTKQMIKDLNEINEKANVAQLQEFTHAILVGKKFTYVTAKTNQELTILINEIVDKNPNEKVSVYEVVFNPIPLKKKTIYTV